MIDRELLIEALRARRWEDVRQDPSLLLMASTHDGSWAREEADWLLRYMRRLLDLRAGR